MKKETGVKDGLSDHQKMSDSDKKLRGENKKNQTPTKPSAGISTDRGSFKLN